MKFLCRYRKSIWVYVVGYFIQKDFVLNQKTKLFIRCVVVKIENPQTGEIFCLMIFLLLFHLTTSVDSVFSLIKDIRRSSAIERKWLRFQLFQAINSRLGCDFAVLCTSIAFSH